MVCVMKRKNTDQLLKELMDSNDLSRVLSDNSACFRKSDLPHGLQALFDQQDMSKSALAKASGISEVYLHQVFSGRRTPSRDRLLCLCIGLGASTEETQSLLQQAHHAPLYARDKRDAVLLFGLSHSLTLPERCSPPAQRHCFNAIQQTRAPSLSAGRFGVLYRPAWAKGSQKME